MQDGKAVPEPSRFNMLFVKRGDDWGIAHTIRYPTFSQRTECTPRGMISLLRERPLKGKLDVNGDRLLVAVQRPSSLNASGLIVEGRSSDP